MAFTYNTLSAITNAYIAPKIVDNTSKGNPYTWWLRENGRMSIRGGTTLRFPIIKSHLNFDWYTGMDSATLEALEPFTAAEFNWYNGRTPFVIPEEDIDKNSGPDGIVDLVDSVEQTASLTLAGAETPIEIYRSMMNLPVDGAATSATLATVVPHA